MSLSGSSTEVNPPAASPGYLRSAGVVGSMTLVSRLTGMLESRVLAHYLGAGLAADAFFVAFRIPNLLRRFTGEGVMVAAFLPTIQEVEGRSGPESARRFVGRFIGTLLVVLAVLCAAGIAGMAGLVALMELGKLAPGAPAPDKLAALAAILGRTAPAPEQWTLATLLGRIMFGYVALVSLVAAISAVLNYRGSFALPAATPIFWNLVVIGSGIGLVHLLGWLSAEKAAVAFAISVLLGGVAQVAAVWPAYKRSGHAIEAGWHARDPDVKLALRRMLPGILGAGVYQINVLVSTLLASSLPDGAQTVLFNATMLGELVLGLFAVSLATASLPVMARQAESGDWNGLRESIGLGLRSSGVLTLPAAVGMAVLAQPIVALLFQTGRFGAPEVAWTATTLVYQASALAFVAGVRVLVPACYALRDYAGPVRIAAVSVIANIGASVLLLEPLGTGGIALANGVAAVLSLALLARHVQSRRPLIPVGDVVRAWGRFILACLPMAAVAALGLRYLGLEQFGGVFETSVRLLPLIGASAAVYWLFLLALGSPEARELLRQLRAGVARRLGSA